MRRFIGLLVLFALTAPAAAQHYGQQRQAQPPVYQYHPAPPAFPSYGGYGSNPNSHYVRPHYNRDGEFNGGYFRTNPNRTQMDNYGTRPHINPYTGRSGQRSGSR